MLQKPLNWRRLGSSLAVVFFIFAALVIIINIIRTPEPKFGMKKREVFKGTIVSEKPYSVSKFGTLYAVRVWFVNQHEIEVVLSETQRSEYWDNLKIWESIFFEPIRLDGGVEILHFYFFVPPDRIESNDVIIEK